MDALSTARQVLTWAADPAGGPMAPVGPLRDAGALAGPDGSTIEALQRLAAVTAARLGAGAPPLGDAGPVGLGALLLAAAVGGRHDDRQPTTLIDAVPKVNLRQSGGWAECVVRHGVVGSALTAPNPGLAGALVEALLSASPLTAVLHRPARTGAGAARSTAIRLLHRRGGAAVLVAAFAAPSVDAAVLNWRAQLLNVLRQRHADVLLDVYVAARLWHGPAWDDRIRWATRELSGLGLPGELPIATGRYWAPLVRMHRDELARAGLGGRLAGRLRPRGTASPDTVHARVFLRPKEYAAAVALVDRHGLLLEGAA